MILFTKQFGEALVIITDTRVLFCRDKDGLVVVSQVDPEYYEEMVGYRHDYSNTRSDNRARSGYTDN